MRYNIFTADQSLRRQLYEIKDDVEKFKNTSGLSL
jgi:hypothetical protein